MEHLQYPIGRFGVKTSYTPEDMEKLLAAMETAPMRYRQQLASTSEAEQAKTYREGSWTVRQVVHHVADIHLLNYLRVKKLLTEEGYIATVIDMDAWAATTDAVTAPISDSLLMLEGINNRLLLLLKSLNEEAFDRTYYHPVRKIQFTLKAAIHMAVWHLEHHLAHIQIALNKQSHSFALA